MKTESWVTPLGELCSIKSGKSDTKDATPDGEYAFFDRSRTVKRSSRYLYDCEALIMPGEGAEFLPKHFKGRFDLHQRAYALFDFHAGVDVRYLYYFLHHAKDYFPRVAVGATVKSLRLRHFQQLPVIVASISEQQRIVAILDEAFEGIAVAKANAEQNVENAQAAMEGHLRHVFDQTSDFAVPGPGQGSGAVHANDGLSIADEAQRGNRDYSDDCSTRTGGRAATTRRIAPVLSLAVGRPDGPARTGWRWIELTDLARLESGHTPSRRHPEWWGGDIPWITLSDARSSHGARIQDTMEHINELGIQNSSARLLPSGTVCLSRTASVGYVTVMDRPMATSQDFVNWVCSDSLDPDFLKYLFLAEGRKGFLRFASGSVHQTVYFPEVKAFCVCVPGIAEQRQIARQCAEITMETQKLHRLHSEKVAALDALKQSLLNQAFSGNL